MAYVGWRMTRASKIYSASATTSTNVGCPHKTQEGLRDTLRCRRRGQLCDFVELVDTAPPKGRDSAHGLLHECQQDKDPKGAIEANYKAIADYCPEIDQVLYSRSTRRTPRRRRFGRMVEGLGTLVNKNMNRTSRS